MDEEESETISKAAHLKRLNAKQGRIDELAGQLAAANKRAKEAEQALSTLDVGKLERKISRLSSEKEDLTAAFEAYKTETATTQALLQAGITDADHQQLVNWRYGQLPPDGRPELGQWLSDTAKEDKLVGHIFGAAEPEPEPRRGLPRSNGGTKPPKQPRANTTLEAFMSKPASYRTSAEGRAEYQTLMNGTP